MILLTILILSFVARLALLLYPSMIWWDTAMYIGIGKYIYTAGKLGVLETFRPPLWPLILGTFWKLGINPSIAGQVLQVLCATATIYLVYKIGEKLLPFAGAYAASLLSVTAIFFASTIIPITDIPSAFLSTLGVWLAIEGSYFLSGLMVGVGFILRFPEALMGPCIALGILIVNGMMYKKTIKEWLKLTAGFAVIAIPYLIVNFFIYSNPFLPIILGNKVFAASQGESTAFFYYVTSLFIENPFLVLFGIAGAIGSLYYIKNMRSSRTLVFSLSSLVLLAGYYMSETHKELRYSISFLPFLAILAGLGISYVTRHLSRRKNIAVLASVSLVVVIWGAAISKPMWTNYELPAPVAAYYSFFSDKPGATVITSTPQIIANNDIKIAEIFDTWQSTTDALRRQADNVDYVAVDTCEAFCDPVQSADSCTEAKAAVTAQLQALKPLFATTTNDCNLTIYTGR
jgi:hypothetical protein